MTSKLVVNTIEADTGISSVSFASSISMNSTAKFHFSAAGIDIGADTNINRPAAGVLGFNINSGEKVRINSNGKVGIATDTGNGLINTRHAGTNQQVLHVRADLGSNNGRVLNIFTPDTDNTTAPFRFQTGNGYLFQCDSEDVFTIAHDRRIGIGTDNPRNSSKLDVHNPTSNGVFINYDGQSNAEYGLRIQSNGSGGNFESDFVNGTTALLDLFANSSSTTGGDLLVARTQSSTPVFLVKGNGRVGIGTNNPSQILNIYGTNVKPVIGDRTAHTPLYSSYDGQNNTSLEITSSGTGTNVAGLTLNNPTTSANTSYKTISFTCSATSSAEKRAALIGVNHDADSSSVVKGNLQIMVNNGTNLKQSIFMNHQGHVTKAHTAMFSARGQGSWNTFNSGSGWYSLGDANIGGTNYYINHGWTTSGGGCAVRGATNAGNSIWENDKARFTAPVTGFYNFEISMYIRTAGGGYTFHVQPWLDSTNLNFYTSNIGNIRNSSNSLTGNTQEYPHVARSINIYMSANQTFQWAIYSQGTSNFLSHFDYAHQSGYLIG